MNLLTKYILPGKKIAIFFYLGGALHSLVPRRLMIWRRRRLVKGWQQRPDADEIRRRVDFCCGPDAPFTLPEADTPTVREITPRRFQSRYAIDAMRTLDYFPAHLRLGFLQGDTHFNPGFPTVAKGRRLNMPGGENAVILKLDSIRHYLTPRDRIPFREKIPKLFFRGDIYGKPHRVEFFRRWAGNPLMDLGDTSPSHPSEWSASFVSIPDHMQYQFILALEGNDVCSALQWIMASNCVPVMTRPTVETWLMHSQLEPGRHYIEIAPDFSDVGEKIKYYTDHPEEAEMISRESKKWAARFADRGRERLISLLVMERYFSLSGQQF